MILHTVFDMVRRKIDFDIYIFTRIMDELDVLNCISNESLDLKKIEVGK